MMVSAAFPFISLYIFSPLIFAVLIMFLKRNNKYVSFVVSMTAVLVQAIMTVLLVSNFDFDVSGYQFTETHNWIPFFNIRYSVGIDATSLIFCILTVIVFWVAHFVGYYNNDNQDKIRNACFLVSFTGLIGTFCATDGFLFYVFWEMVIIPAFIVMKFSETNTNQFSLQFLIYSLIGSFMIFAGIIFISLSHLFVNGALSFNMSEWFNGDTQIIDPLIVFSFFLFGFAIKTPLFPLHSWMPAAYTGSPISLTILMSGIFSKLGIYGIVRFLIPLFGDIMHTWRFELMLLSVIGTLYAALIAMYSQSPKKILAYSSMAHMGLISFGLFSLSHEAIKGGLFQVISHGVVSAALFAGLGILYAKFQKNDHGDIRGLWKTLPVFSFFFIFISLANLALPGTTAFIGEFRILVGAFSVDYFLTGFITISTVFSAIYMLNLVRRIIFGEYGNHLPVEVNDFNSNEYTVFAVLSVVIIFLGVYPNILSIIIDSSFLHFIEPRLPLPLKAASFA